MLAKQSVWFLSLWIVDIKYHFPAFSTIGHTLTFVIQFKYLGHVIINDDEDIKRGIKALLTRCNILRFKWCAGVVENSKYDYFRCTEDWRWLRHSFYILLCATQMTLCTPLDFYLNQNAITIVFFHCLTKNDTYF